MIRCFDYPCGYPTPVAEIQVYMTATGVRGS